MIPIIYSHINYEGHTMTYQLRPKADYDQVCAAIAIATVDPHSKFIYGKGKYPVLTRLMLTCLRKAEEGEAATCTIGFKTEGADCIDNHTDAQKRPCCQIIADHNIEATNMPAAAPWLLAGIWAETAKYKDGKPEIAEKLEKMVRESYQLGNTEDVYNYIEELFAFTDEEKAKIAAATAACAANDTTANGIRVIRSASDADWTPASDISRKETFEHCHTLLIFMNDKLSFRGDGSEKSAEVRRELNDRLGGSGSNPKMGSWDVNFDEKLVEAVVETAYRSIGIVYP